MDKFDIADETEKSLNELKRQISSKLKSRLNPDKHSRSRPTFRELEKRWKISRATIANAKEPMNKVSYEMLFALAIQLDIRFKIDIGME